MEAELDNEEMYTNKKKDKTFSAFQKRVKQYGDQVLRYYGVLANAPPPLWVSDEGQPKESDVPTCEGCGSKRVAEFQVEKLFFVYINVYRLCLNCCIN